MVGRLENVDVVYVEAVGRNDQPLLAFTQDALTEDLLERSPKRLWPVTHLRAFC
jgi:hypothetical protein